jgi:hypothetical protein
MQPIRTHNITRTTVDTTADIMATTIAIRMERLDRTLDRRPLPFRQNRLRFPRRGTHPDRARTQRGAVTADQPLVPDRESGKRAKTTAAALAVIFATSVSGTSAIKRTQWQHRVSCRPAPTDLIA